MHPLRLGFLFAIACSLFAQRSAPKLEFEVASVKLSPPPDLSRGMTSSLTGELGTDSPLLFRCTNLDLKSLIERAYSVTAVQVSGPDWMGNQKVDISAKVPAGATAEQFREMLQNLLIDRFQLVVHRETRDQPKYDLVVASGGPKLMGAAGEVRPRPELSKGRVRRYRRETMDSFASYLTLYLGKFVTNSTGLKGEYDINVSWVQSDLTSTPDGNASEPTLEHALQEQLGLQLRGARGPVEFLVVDHAEKVPAEN